MEDLPAWLYQTLVSLIVSASVFIAGMWATQGTLVERIDNLAVQVNQSEARQSASMAALRNDFNDMRRDLYSPNSR